MDAMLATADRGLAQANSAKQRQLTAEVIERTRLARNTAQEVRGRLSELRDRIFGPPPPSPTGAPDTPVGDSFAATYDDVAGDLERYLSDIDRLSADIANRL